MTHEELAALLAEETHTFRCGECGRQWITGRGTVVLYHTCQATLDRRHRGRGLVGLPDPEYPSLEERWHSLFFNVGGGYTPPTPQQAREETGPGGKGIANTRRDTGEERDQ